MVDNNKGMLENEIDDDFTLDDLPDLPGYVVPPTGSYLVSLEKGIELKEINDDNYYEVQMTILEAVEVDPKNLDEGETVPKTGDICSALFKRNNEYGMGNFKNFVGGIAEMCGSRKIADIREVSKGMQLMVTVKRTYNKEKDRHNFNIKSAVPI